MCIMIVVHRQMMHQRRSISDRSSHGVSFERTKIVRCRTEDNPSACIRVERRSERSRNEIQRGLLNGNKPNRLRMVRPPISLQGLEGLKSTRVVFGSASIGKMSTGSCSCAQALQAPLHFKTFRPFKGPGDCHFCSNLFLALSAKSERSKWYPAFEHFLLICFTSF